MRRLKWLLQIWFMWHVIKIIKTQGEMKTKENIFSVLRYPAVKRVENRDIIKYFPKLCYDDNNDDDDNDNDQTTDSLRPTTEEQHAFELLNMFKNIVQQIQKSNCRKTKSFFITTMTTTMPQAEILPQTFERSQRVYQKDVQQQQPKQQPEVGENRADRKEFSIFEQLKLDEMEALQEKHQQAEKQQLQQQQQKLLRLQQMQNMQHILETLNTQNLAKATKKKKKKKRKNIKKPSKNKKRKQKKKPAHTSLVAQPAHILFASANPLTTKKPYEHNVGPVKNIKYILRKNSILKKKKKEYFNHLKHVLYPFVKFIAFFTILNPFTLAVFLFSLISPVVFGLIGFMGLSFLIKPALHLLFGVKRTVNSISRQKWLQHQTKERLRHSRRPITIHKHYYEQRPMAAPPPKSKDSHRNPQPNHHQHSKRFNPILPHVRHKLQRDSFERWKDGGNN